MAFMVYCNAFVMLNSWLGWVTIFLVVMSELSGQTDTILKAKGM